MNYTMVPKNKLVADYQLLFTKMPIMYAVCSYSLILLNSWGTS